MSTSAEHVILISVDGLQPDAITGQSQAELPNFYRLRDDGAFTDDARTDFHFTNTLPNHTSMVTGRPVQGTEGHNYTDNGDPTTTIHLNKGEYVSSMWDVAHDAGLSTSLFASKSKFSLFDDSYDEDSGAAHTNGADKIDAYAHVWSGSGVNQTARPAVDDFLADMWANRRHLSMLHIRDPDSAGHAAGWMSSDYLSAVDRADDMLGQVFDLIEKRPVYTGRTAIVLTSDHGGTGGGHGDPTSAANYTIPLYVWGPSVTAGADLYALNPASRVDPGTGRPDYTGLQPIRNGGAGNLALSLLGLPPIPGSGINEDQSLGTM